MLIGLADLAFGQGVTMCVEMRLEASSLFVPQVLLLYLSDFESPACLIEDLVDLSSKEVQPVVEFDKARHVLIIVLLHESEPVDIPNAMIG